MEKWAAKQKHRRLKISCQKPPLPSYCEMEYNHKLAALQDSDNENVHDVLSSSIFSNYNNINNQDSDNEYDELNCFARSL